jgi:hypothetical protein
MRVERPTDEVQILIRPAARVVDPVRNRVVDSGCYTLVLLNVEGNELRESSSLLSWEKAVATARLFSGEQVAEALKWWDRKPP